MFSSSLVGVGDDSESLVDSLSESSVRDALSLSSAEFEPVAVVRSELGGLVLDAVADGVDSGEGSAVGDGCQ